MSLRLRKKKEVLATQDNPVTIKMPTYHELETVWASRAQNEWSPSSPNTITLTDEQLRDSQMTVMAQITAMTPENWVSHSISLSLS